MCARVLLVEDEIDLVASVVHTLGREGYTVEHVATAAAARRAIARSLPAVVLLDRMLPDLPGTTLCRELRADPATAALPVIMVTALGDDLDRIVGLEVGADDYLAKPYHPRELVLRIAAVLRRAERAAPTDDAPVQLGPLRLDTEGWRAWSGEIELALTVLEFKMLLAFAERPGVVLERRELVRAAWGPGHHVTERAVDTHVRRLRLKLGDAAACLQTVRTVGYRWSLDGGAA